MDAQRFRDAFERLELLDDRMTHKVRPRASLQRPTEEQLVEQVRELAAYTVDLKEIVHELFLAIGGKPGAPAP